MDPGSALVTAYPLPPNYFVNFKQVDEILCMKPPPPPTNDCTSFGTIILKDGLWSSLAEPFKVSQVAIEGKSIGIAFHYLFQASNSLLVQLVDLLGKVKSSILLNYIQLIELVASGGNSETNKECMENFLKAQQAAMYILASLRRHQGLVQLRDELGNLVNNKT